MAFYFKRKRYKHVEESYIDETTGEKHTRRVKKESWNYIGIVSPFKSDYMIMETTNLKERIHHNQDEVDRVRALLWHNRITYRLYDAETNELLEPIIVND